MSTKNTIPYNRLEQIMEYYELNPNSFANKIGLKRTQNLYDIRDGKIKNITFSLANKINTVFTAINKNWLLTGEGEMLNKEISNNDFLSHLSDPEPRINEQDVYKKLEEIKKKKNKNPEPSSRVINDDDLVDAIEYKVPWKGQAGMASKFYPEEMIEQLQKTVVKVKPEYRGVFYRIEVDGNSMPPKIQPGDWLRCEEISSLFWLEKNFFKKEKIYCIWHNSRGIIFKRLIYKELGEIWCSSDNEDKLEFPDFPLEIEKVNKILIVRSLVDRKF